MTTQPIPSVSAEDVDRIDSRDFSPDQVNQVAARLAEYATAAEGREPHRVQMAVLKLALGSVERLERSIEAATVDYRDVLSAAEYPEYSQHAPGLLPDERQHIIDADWNQYQEWLTR